MIIGFLHPGLMGVSLAASARAGGHRVIWASEGRGEATRARAEEHGLEDVGTVARLGAEAEIIFSVCPPAAAEDVARAVAASPFEGLYVDANAISPARMERVMAIVETAGAQVVDGGIIGPPAWTPGKTSLHLSGRGRERVAECFEGGLVRVDLMSDQVGEASALKMCYAAFTKGQAALLAAILASAESLGVRDALYARWAADGRDTVSTREASVQGVTAKAWRWVDELEEIAGTFERAGQPAGFHLAAAEIYRRLADLKDAPQPVAIDEILARLRQ